VNCDDWEWWDGKRDTPAKIVDLILFAYELDTLEIRLHELDEVVDEFVIAESMYSTRLLHKELFFAEFK
jgi:beta-1,4-mannosyl-glycoprotein beta-1,4-N-acetylglucosaminyltransferase